jgi:hypothetical protein
MLSLKELAYKTIVNSLSSEKKYRIENNIVLNEEESKEIKYIYTLIKSPTTIYGSDLLKKQKYNRGVSIIKKYIRKYWLPVIINLHYYKLQKIALFNVRGKEVIIKTNNLYYFDYLNKSSIQSITLVNNILKIQVDRFIIRHCYDRWITINLNTKELIWHDISPNDKNCRSNRIEVIDKKENLIEIILPSDKHFLDYRTLPLK